MKKIQKQYENKIIIETSIFITRLFRVNNQDEINSYLEEIRKKHFDATHNCYAYILGENQDIQKASDDGEPQKTAGAPMLEVLKRNIMTNILAIVTRYFGGTLLGAAGLIKAYSDSVSFCLLKATIYETKKMNLFSLTLSYSGYNTILKAIPYINISNVSFTDNVTIEAYCDIDKYNNLKDELYKYKIDPSALIDLGYKEIEIEIKK